MTMAWALRNLLWRSPGESQSNGSESKSGSGEGEGEGENQGDPNDPDADLRGMSDTDLVKALKAERSIRRTAESESRTLRREKSAREQKERDDAAEIARQNGEWQKLAETAAAERDAEIARREELERSVIEDRKKNAIRFEAAKLNFHDPEEAVSLLDLTTIDLDENQRPVGVLDVVKRLANTKKHLVKVIGRDGMPETPTQQGNNRETSHVRSYISQKYGSPPAQRKDA